MKNSRSYFSHLTFLSIIVIAIFFFSFTNSALATCLDTDNGQNFGVKGTVTVTTVNSSGQTTQAVAVDSCVGTTIREYFCLSSASNAASSVQSACGTDKTCANGACVATNTTPSPASINYSPTGTWVRGTTKTVNWTTSSFNSNIDIWLCSTNNYLTGKAIAETANGAGNCTMRILHGVANTGSVSVSVPTNAVTGKNYYFYIRKADDWPNTWAGNAFGSTAVVVGSATSACLTLGSACGEANITTSCCSGYTCSYTANDTSVKHCVIATGVTRLPVTPTTTPPNINPSVSFVSGIDINSQARVPSLLAGSQFNIAFTALRFMQDYSLTGAERLTTGQASTKVNKISFYLCTSVAGRQFCYALPDESTLTKTIDGKIYYSSVETSETIRKTMNLKIDLTKAKAQGLLDKTFTIKACPMILVSYRSGAFNKQYYRDIYSGNCGLSGSFKLLDPHNSYSSLWNLPAGQGCIVGECVCVNGMAKRCGNPMTSGFGCPASSGCPAGVTVTEGDKLIASLGALLGVKLFNW